MADRKRRVRRAPTIREVVEQKTEAAKQPKRGSRLKSLSNAASRLSFAREILRPIGWFLRPLMKVLGWLVPRYFINSWREVLQVTWPTRRETWRLTLAVFIFAIIFGVLITVADKGIDEIFKKVILR